MSRAYWRFAVLLIALQIGDIVTTNCALAVPGVWEANPLMALLQDRLGTAWWLPKIVAVSLFCLAPPVVERQWPMVVVAAYYAMVVSLNIAQL